METYSHNSEFNTFTDQLIGVNVSNGEKVLYDLLFSEKEEMNGNESKNGITYITYHNNIIKLN